MTSLEIESLIAQLKLGKAPGADLIPAEAIKNNSDFWVPTLASLFTGIDTYGYIPEDWGLSIIVPIYKKGGKDDPTNYRPISLLNTISKLYARHLQWKLEEWLRQENILADEQAGFREGRTTIDQCLVLQHLIEKYSSSKIASLYVAFIDFRAAFDSISRTKLWEKLETSTIDRRLLYLIRMLYEGTSLKVRYTSQGHVSKAIETEKGVKQGCILAPSLFNYYINDMIPHLSDINFHPPKLAGNQVSVLLYADDAAILSRTPIGLKRAMKTLAAYCTESKLELNYQKTKIMVFAKRPKTYVWSIDGHKIEQVTCFKYLGIALHSSGSRKTHGMYVAGNAQRSANAILRYLRSKGGNYIPAALKLFEAKSIAQLLYGAQLGPFTNYAPLEVVQSKFLRSALQVPRYVSNATIRLETGVLRIEARVWLAILNYWLRLVFFPSGLAPLTIKDDFQTTWKGAVGKIIATLGFNPQTLLAMGYEGARNTIKQRVVDTQRQVDLASSPRFLISENRRYLTTQMPYVANLEIPKQRRAFTLARCRALPSAMQEGRYEKIPHEERKCPCGAGQQETLEHVFFYCKYYTDVRARFIQPILDKSPGLSEQHNISLLLQDESPEITYAVARFCAALIDIRRKMVCDVNRL